MKRAILVIGLLGLLIAPAFAQEITKATIPFEFVAGQTTLPAGTYEFKPMDNSRQMQVQNVTTGKSVMVPVMTRLGTGEAGVAKVTFDKVGNKTMLETVLPGTGDGYLLHVTKGKHTHNIVKAG